MAFPRTNRAPQRILNAPAPLHEPHWYRKAVFRNLLAQPFADGNAGCSNALSTQTQAMPVIDGSEFGY